MRRAAVVLAALVLVVASLAAVRDDPFQGPQNDLMTAMVTGWGSCGFPPTSARTFVIERPEAIALGECLYAEGHLTETGLANLRYERADYRIEGTWDGEPGSSGLTVGTPTYTIATLAESPTVTVRGFGFSTIHLLVALAVAVGLIWGWRTRVRGARG